MRVSQRFIHSVVVEPVSQSGSPPFVLDREWMSQTRYEPKFSTWVYVVGSTPCRTGGCNTVPAKILHRGTFHFHCPCRRWTKNPIRSGGIIVPKSSYSWYIVLQLLSIDSWIPQLESHPTKLCDKNLDSRQETTATTTTTTGTAATVIHSSLFIVIVTVTVVITK